MDPIIIGNPNPQPKTIIAGVEMITTMQLGEVIGSKAPSTISDFAARAGIPRVPIKKRFYYAWSSVQSYFRGELKNAN